MNDLRIELILPIREHAELILKWRNDPLTRKNSFHEEIKAWPDFYEEFKNKYFLFPELPPLFAVLEGQRVAFIRFDPCEDYECHLEEAKRRACNLSINVAPLCRGKGVGSAVLELAKSFIKRQGYHVIYGEVKEDNIYSQRAFLKAGFRAIEGCQKNVDGNQLTIIRYIAEVAHPDVNNVYIVAEAGSNWRMGSYERDLAMAKTLIKIAAEAEANAVKFQVFQPDKIYVDNAGPSDYLAKNEINQSMSALFADLMLPYEMLFELSQECIRQNISFMATPFSPEDFSAVDPLVSHHKIASYELNYPHLLALAAKSGKPLMLSTGASNEEEIAWAVDFFFQKGGKNLTLMQCTAAYPASLESMNLNALLWLNKRFQVAVGLSDHSLDPVCAPLAAVALGAKVIEKHFTLDKRLPGPDHPFALNPIELKKMVQAVRRVEKMGGSFIKEVHPIESELRQFARRGVQALKEIAEGETFKEGKNLAVLRPGKQKLGLHPKFLSEIEGKKAKRHILKGEGLQRGDF